MTLTAGSLFSGIGGLDLGLEWAGFEIKWQVEIDPFCRKVLKKHWPDVARYEDVRTVGTEQLETVDLIAGGFPCQDVSTAGERKGLSGERSILWDEFARIIGEIRPRWVLVENVPGVLSSDLGRFMGGIIWKLAGFGYVGEWNVLPAAAFGAPHLRERVFIVGRLNSSSGGRQPGAVIPFVFRDCVLPERGFGGRDSAGRGDRLLSGGNGDSKEILAHTWGDRLEKWDGIRPFWKEADPPITSCNWWAVEPGLDRMAHGVPARVDRIKALGNAVVPQVAEWIARRIIEADRGNE